MRVKRIKTFKRRLTVYQNVFGLRRPYQVILDGNFVAVAVKHRVDLRSYFERYLGTQHYKELTTRCILQEVKSLGEAFSGASVLMKRFGKRFCDHKEICSAASCIKSIVGATNEHHYIVATQDLALRAELRKIPGVVLLYLHGNVLMMEPFSPSSLDSAKRKEGSKERPASFEKPFLANYLKDKKEGHNKEDKQIAEGGASLAAMSDGSPGPSTKPPPKRKAISAPNPLSIKKKKKKVNNNSNESATATATTDTTDSVRNRQRTTRRRRHRPRTQTDPSPSVNPS